MPHPLSSGAFIILTPSCQSSGNVAAFIELLNNQPELFSSQDLADLAQLIEPIPDKIEDLSNALAQWYSQEGHSAQLDALRQMLQALSSATVEKLLGTDTGIVQTPESPLNKQMLQNAIGL